MCRALAATSFRGCLQTELLSLLVRTSGHNSIVSEGPCGATPLRISPLDSSVVAGSLYGYVGDGGMPLRARMQFPQATYWDGTILWIVDNGNAAVRAVLPAQQAS